MCFEDTAVLIGICTLFWLLAGIKFLVPNGLKSSLPLSILHICKLVNIHPPPSHCLPPPFAPSFLPPTAFPFLPLPSPPSSSLLSHFSSSLLTVLSIPQVLVGILFLTAVCDLGYTIYQGRFGQVAQFLYLSSAMLTATMASPAYCTHTHTHTHTHTCTNVYTHTCTSTCTCTCTNIFMWFVPVCSTCAVPWPAVQRGCGSAAIALAGLQYSEAVGVQL